MTIFLLFEIFWRVFDKSDRTGHTPVKLSDYPL